MSTPTIFILAIVAAIADVAAILTWLKIEPQHIFSRSWWQTRQVTIAGGKLFLISTLAVVSLALSSYGFYSAYNNQSPMPRILQWGLDNRLGNKYCTVTADTSPVSAFADKYSVVLACGIVDATIDKLQDKRIILSGPFSISGGSQQMSAAFTPDFEKVVESFGIGVSIWQVVFLFPKGTDISRIHELSDVPSFGGKLYK